MERKEMFVPFWTIKKKYDCPECKGKKTIKHSDYACKDCGQVFKLKVKMAFN